MEPKKPTIKVLLNDLTRRMGWTRTSYYLISSFILIIFLIVYIWWPLVTEYFQQYNPNYPIWRQVDWLLVGIFLFMSLVIMAGADIKKDLPILMIGLVGGLVIESWGTQTELWTYYTFERPPLWIIPAWPIASLTIDRVYRFSESRLTTVPDVVFRTLYWIILPLFLLLMFPFTAPTIDKSLTIMALILAVFLILTPTNHRAAVLVFLVGSGLGYYLEVWGTTRLTWTYYTLERPPLFAVFAHGMAALAFWRVLLLYKVFEPRLQRIVNKTLQV